MTVANAANSKKTVADPNAAYESVRTLWDRSRAVCGGDKYVKEYDGVLDKIYFSNLLIPFSPYMTQEQYNFYKAEAELPGITKEYAKIIKGGLLRKPPQIMLPKALPEEALEWITSQFGEDNSSMIAFLDSAIDDEIKAKTWVYVDYPVVNVDTVTPEELKALKPYAVLWSGESVINWSFTNGPDGSRILKTVVVRGFSETDGDNEFHKKLVSTVWVHELVKGKYQIRTFTKKNNEAQVPVINGQTREQIHTTASGDYELTDTNVNILMNGERLTIIPAWPLNGNVNPSEPLLNTIVDREIALYNKVSRRNHLLYGAATYTPVISSDMADEKKDEIVGSGLGSWIMLARGDTASCLATPTEALSDMEKAIASGISEIARLGVRMLAPESIQSGVALEIRDAPQTASLGILNTRISAQMADVICFMLNWKYNMKLKTSEVDFTLSPDFNPTPLGADWLRLVTEWYQNGLIPRSEWLSIGKHNDIISADYNDEDGQKEINDDSLIVNPREQADYASKLASQMAK